MPDHRAVRQRRDAALEVQHLGDRHRDDLPAARLEDRRAAARCRARWSCRRGRRRPRRPTLSTSPPSSVPGSSSSHTSRPRASTAGRTASVSPRRDSRTGTRDHGEVVEDDHGVLDEHRVGVVIGRRDLDRREAVRLERGDVADPLRPCELGVDRHAVEVRPPTLGETGRGLPNQRTRPTRWVQRKKCLAREVHRHARRLGRLDRLVVAHRPARLDDRAHARSDQDARSVGEWEERVTRRDRLPRRGRRPGAPPSSHESTRLTWPIPMPTDALSCASRMAFDFTDRTARHANSRSARVAASRLLARTPAASRTSRSRRRSRPTARAHRRRSAAPRGSGDGSPRGRTSSRRFFFAARISSASGSNPGATITSVKMSLIDSAASRVIEAVRGDHPAERRHRVAGVRLRVRLCDGVAPTAMPHGFACFR